MKKIMKGLFMAAVSLVFFVTIVPLQTQAADLTYKIVDGTAVVSKCYKYAKGPIVIEETYNGYPVTEIADSAFSYTNVYAVELPDTITKIGDSAFSNCGNLESINIPDSVVEIGNYAFFECGSLKTATLSENITRIPKSMFNRCFDLMAVTIPEGVVEISESAFYDCDSLETISIPDSVTSIAQKAFTGCEKLNSVKLSKSITALPVNVFYGCSSLKVIHVPYGVTSIDDKCFYKCTALKEVYIPKSVTKIDSDAFYRCDESMCIYSESEMVRDFAKNQGFKYEVWFDGELSIDAEKTEYHLNDKFDKNGIKLIASYPDGTVGELKEYTVKNFNSSKAGTCRVTIEYNKKTVEFDVNIHKEEYSEKKLTKQATVNSAGYYTQTCAVCGSEKRTSIPKIGKVTCAESVVYSGSKKAPVISVKNANGKAIDKSNYTVTGTKSAKNVGTYKLTIKFKNEYSGEKTFTWKVLPKSTSISSITTGSKRINVSWKKAANVTGYQIQYSKNKNMSNAKSVKVAGSNKTSKVITGLSNTKYYVQVRTYKTVSGKTLYSAWSGKKNATVLKDGLNKTVLRLKPGYSEKLKVNNYTGKVTWSSNSKYITVNKKGLVTVKRNATATITAKLANGKKYKCKVYGGSYLNNVEIKLQGGTNTSENVYLIVNNYSKEQVRVGKVATYYPFGDNYSGFDMEHIYFGLYYRLSPGEKGVVTFETKSGARLARDKDQGMLCNVEIGSKDYWLYVTKNSYVIF